MRKYILIFLFLIPSYSLFAQAWLWGAEGDKGNSDTYPVAIDKKDNVFFTGIFSDSVSFGKYHLWAQSMDIFLVKYDSSGNVQWATQSKMANLSSVISSGFDGMSNDNYGGVYVTATLRGVGIISFDSDTIKALTGDQVFLVRYDSNGKVLWAKQSYGNSVPNSNSVTSDKMGNAYLSGVFTNTLTFGSFSLTCPPSSYVSFFLVKYDSSGNVKWAIKGDELPNSPLQTNAITSDKEGNIYIIGVFYGTVIFGTDTLKALNNNSVDVFLVKYNSVGNELWARQSEVPSGYSNGFGYGVSADGKGAAYITGAFQDTVSFGTYTLVTGSFVELGDMFLVKYDSNGSVMWAKQSYHHSDSDGWSGWSVAVDTSYNIYLTGGSYYPGNGEISFGQDTFSYHRSDIDPSIILKIDSKGNVICGSIISSGGDDGNQVVVDPSGKYVYLGGDLISTMVFGQDTLKYNFIGGEEPFIARWQPCETPIDTIPVDTIPTKEPCSSLFVPTAFSPNKDGQNDILYVRGNCIKTMDFVIYDRWGNRVFESNNLSYGWDGTYKGMAENTAVFAYYLHATLQDGTSVDKKGNISLIR